ncbi:alpha/beta hydrolase [Streptomyces sp. Caat 7-52]|uniref:alpha/beta fold hydrolase n=1 Tax=Streptomyces sp. Caat 7-52 TaxID=2949637 RepID=UPI00203650AE|nr:alpha/beta hydrolase [Streptomyces sp. Caat 7-52]
MTGVPVVLLHALSLHAGMWREPADALRARGHSVLAVDQRGFGTAALGTAGPSLDVVADDLARTLDDNGVDRAVLVGSSMGGYTAMAFLRRHPDRVAGLALLAARATADSPEAAARRHRFADLVQQEEPRRQLLAQTSPVLVGATTRATRPEVLARVLADVEAADPAALAWAQRAIAARPDSTDVLRTARVPALVIAGAEDELVAAPESRHVADTLPYGRLVTVPGAGHLPPLETPGAVTDALHTFLTEIGAPAW